MDQVVARAGANHKETHKPIKKQHVFDNFHSHTDDIWQMELCMMHILGFFNRKTMIEAVIKQHGLFSWNLKIRSRFNQGLECNCWSWLINSEPKCISTHTHTPPNKPKEHLLDQKLLFLQNLRELSFVASSVFFRERLFRKESVLSHCTCL